MREARLKPEYADRYPPLDPGEWIPAAVASARMLIWQTRHPDAATLVQRTLDPGHFDFRGGPDADAAGRAAGSRAGEQGDVGMPGRREARLRAGSASLYPALPSETWMAAAELGGILLRWIASGGTPPPLGARLLPEEHFEFRGGELPRGPVPSPRTRRDDQGRGELAAG